MLVLRRGFVAALVVSAASAAIAACSGPRSRGDAQPSASVLPSNQQEGAPYPADMEHLDQILATGSGHNLPEGARVTSVTPALEYVKANPRGWGYVIAFTATDPAMRQYVTDTTIFSGDIIEKAPTAKPGGIQTLDLNFDDIGEPWKVGLSDGVLVLERPLGRGWLIIIGSSG
ncbi:hypothetical protein AoKodu_01230 [Actinomyces oris K20]|nr:hypothetical protein AoKodu_01230 [Actinomyces oris K20]